MHLGITCGIAVIDRGISSAENTAFLRQKRWHVLCGLKRSPAIEAALGADFSSAELCQLDHRVHVQQTVFYVRAQPRSEEHTSELQSRRDLVCRLLLEKKKQ